MTIDLVCRPKIKQTHRIDVGYCPKCDGASIRLRDSHDKVFAEVHITNDALSDMIDQLLWVEDSAALFRTVRVRPPKPPKNHKMKAACVWGPRGWGWELKENDTRDEVNEHKRASGKDRR
jgi:hypothetical protein